MHIRTLCTLCSRDDDQVEALYSCTSTCCVDLKLCAFHHKRHLAKFPTHEFNKLKIEEDTSICPRHPLQPINVYCKNCECLLCPMCAISIEHKGHDCNLIDEIAGMERESIPQQVEELTKKINEWHQQHGTFNEKDLNMEIELIEKKRIELKNEIHNGIEKMKQQLDKRKEELLKSTEVICDQNSNIVKTILGFKNQTQDLINTFNELGKMSNFDVMMAKVTKFNQLSNDFNLIDENYCGLNKLSEFHDITIENFQSKLVELTNSVDKMGNICSVDLLESKVKVNVKFTNLGAEGIYGPTSIGNRYDDNEYLNNKVTLKDGIQYWNIPFNGKYKITAAGASGGVGSNINNNRIREGYGCIVSGDFELKKGTTLKILVGQQGGSSDGETLGGGGGGGGGTFIVTEQNSSPLLIAASGGNGCNWYQWNTNGPGGRLYNKNIPITIGKAEGYGGGGGGFEHNGTDSNTNVAKGGLSFKNGGLGGEYFGGANGGFGGGGASQHEGGGGGGYIGGSVVPLKQYDTSYPTYGAVSFNCGENQDGKEDSNNGHGYVIIERL